MSITKIVKRVVFISAIYLIAVLSTVIINERIEQLESMKDFRNNNQSLSINLSK